MTNLRLAKQLADLAEPLDEVADPVQEAVNAVPQPVRDVLDGVWLGNPLHPALTDIPLGAWTAALALDLVGSDAADGALAVGILGAVPAALTGLNDWGHLKDEVEFMDAAAKGYAVHEVIWKPTILTAKSSENAKCI